MEIISIDETRAVEAAKYVSRLNKINEHKCKACPTEYKNILHSQNKKKYIIFVVKLDP